MTEFERDTAHHSLCAESSLSPTTRGAVHIPFAHFRQQSALNHLFDGFPNALRLENDKRKGLPFKPTLVAAFLRTDAFYSRAGAAQALSGDASKPA